MRFIPRWFRILICYFPGKWGGALGAVLVFSAILSLPGEGRAAVTYGLQSLYQWNESTNVATSKAVQERFSFFFNMNTRTSSKLTLSGAFKFDVLLDKNTASGQSTQLQPDIDVGLSTRAVQLGLGYRQILRNESIISGVGTTNLASDSKEVYVDTGIHAGRLPDIRLRYSIRDQKQVPDIGTESNTSTKEFRASMNYRLGIISVIADYLNQSINDKVAATVKDLTQINGQASIAKTLGPKTSFSLRENYSYGESTTNGVTDSKLYTSTSEGRLNFNPFSGAAMSTNYVYRLSEDIFAGTGRGTEKTWFTSANYALPRFLRFYGSYNLNQHNATGTATDGNTTIIGMNFNHSIGKLGMSARYEKRYDDSSSTASGITTQNKSTSDNIDWFMSLNLASYLNLGLSESYVLNTANGQGTSSNSYRFKANFGPVHNFTLLPYLTYTIATTDTGPSTTTTECVVPVAYNLNLHRKVDISFMDSYRWNKTSTPPTSTIATSNTATARLTYAGPFPNTRMEVDSTFASSGSSGSPTVTTTTYAVLASWVKSVHAVNANYRYQTGSNTAPSYNMALQYGFTPRFQKLALSFQARYEYSATNSTPRSTAQTVYLVLNIRK